MWGGYFRRDILPAAGDQHRFARSMSRGERGFMASQMRNGGVNEDGEPRAKIKFGGNGIEVDDDRGLLAVPRFVDQRQAVVIGDKDLCPGDRCDLLRTDEGNRGRIEMTERRMIFGEDTRVRRAVRDLFAPDLAGKSTVDTLIGATTASGTLTESTGGVLSVTPIG